MAAFAYQICHNFANHYYHMLCQTPEFSHMFYGDSSTITLIDADRTETVWIRLDIHGLLTSLRVTEVALSELTVQISWNGGILFIVSGNMESLNFNGKRKFSQTFFLAPWVFGYFILNDILQIQDRVPEEPDIIVDEQPAISVSSHELEGAREYNSLHTEDDQQHEDLQLETAVQEASVEQSSPLESVVNHLEDPIHLSVLPPASARVDELAAESVGEPARVSNDSILQAPKGQSSESFVPHQPSVRQSMPAPNLGLKIQGNEQQLNSSTSSFVPKEAVTGEDDILVQEVKLTSVLVGNLPPRVTNADLEKEFKNFGKIKPNGVTIRNKTETGVCFAFVEFEDMSGANNAIKASHINFLGNQVYIEERISSSSSSTRGGVVQGGRGRYPGYSTLFGRYPGYWTLVGLLLAILLLLTCLVTLNWGL